MNTLILASLTTVLAIVNLVLFILLSVQAVFGIRLQAWWADRLLAHRWLRELVFLHVYLPARVETLRNWWAFKRGYVHRLDRGYAVPLGKMKTHTVFIFGEQRPPELDANLGSPSPFPQTHPGVLVSKSYYRIARA